MGKATGVLLIILGSWLVIASLAGRLPERILSLVSGSGPISGGGTRTGSTPGPPPVEGEGPR